MRRILTSALLLGLHGFAPAQEPAHLKARLEALCEAKPAKPEALTRKASLLVQADLENKRWSEVAGILRKSGFTIPEGRAGQSLTTFTLPVRKAALNAGGYPFDLELEITTNRDSQVPFEGKPNMVLGATARLAATVADETEEIVGGELFGPRTVLTRLLNSDTRRKTDKDYKFLRRIELSYELIKHHREAEFPFGYHVRLSFGHDPGSAPPLRVFYTVRSREDLPRDLEGKPIKNWQGWQNTALREIQSWGSSETHPAK